MCPSVRSSSGAVTASLTSALAQERVGGGASVVAGWRDRVADIDGRVRGPDRGLRYRRGLTCRGGEAASELAAGAGSLLPVLEVSGGLRLGRSGQGSGSPQARGARGGALATGSGGQAVGARRLGEEPARGRSRLCSGAGGGSTGAGAGAAASVVVFTASRRRSASRPQPRRGAASVVAERRGLPLRSPIRRSSGAPCLIGKACTWMGYPRDSTATIRSAACLFSVLPR